MPIKQPGVKSRARKVTAEEKKFSAFATLRKVNYITSFNLNVTNFIIVNMFKLMIYQDRGLYTIEVSCGCVVT
jgi:hypothetical protein